MVVIGRQPAPLPSQPLASGAHEWTHKRLRELLTQDATYGIVKAGSFVRSGVPMLRGGDIKNGRIAREMPHVSQNKSEEFKRTVLQQSDVVIALVGYPGEAAVVPGELSGANISRAVGLLRPSPALSSDFLVCYLNSAVGRAEFLKPSAGSAQIVVNLRDLNNLLVPLPPTKREQEAIAEALSDADALIESLERLIAKKRAIKQGAMQELLTGRRRLSGFSEPWRQVGLGELLSKLANGAVYKPASRDGLAVTRIETIAAGFVDYARTGIAEPSTGLEPFRMQAGDILYSHINSVDHIGKVALYRGENELYHGMNLLLLRCNEAVDPRFLYQTLSSEPLRQTARTLAKQAVSQASINTADMRSIQVRLPHAEEQRAIADTLGEMDADLVENEARLIKASQIKHGMMQELLTGRVRLV